MELWSSSGALLFGLRVNWGVSLDPMTTGPRLHKAHERVKTTTAPVRRPTREGRRPSGLRRRRRNWEVHGPRKSGCSLSWRRRPPSIHLILLTRARHGGQEGVGIIRYRENERYHILQPLTPQTQTRPNRLHTHTHPAKCLAHPRSPIPPLSTLTSRATHAHPNSPRSTGFCAIWDCIS